MRQELQEEHAPKEAGIVYADAIGCEGMKAAGEIDCARVRAGRFRASRLFPLLGCCQRGREAPAMDPSRKTPGCPKRHEGREMPERRGMALADVKIVDRGVHVTRWGQMDGLSQILAPGEDMFVTEPLGKLAGEADPELKRKIIGNTFIDIFDEEAGKLENANWLAQGTIYPDVIESAASKTGKAHVIKSHHNVGGLPEDMKLKLVEPLRELFKDEVRKIGLELGLPYDMVYRHPFPGPGLGVRILGEVKKEYADTLRLADHIFIEELRAAGLYHKTSQAFAVFLPVKSVGVVGDARRYEYVVALRAVETIDFMTARWAHLPYEFLELVSSRIINEIPGISRVTYDISSKPPATIEWE